MSSYVGSIGSPPASPTKYAGVSYWGTKAGCLPTSPQPSLVVLPSELDPFRLLATSLPAILRLPQGLTVEMVEDALPLVHLVYSISDEEEGVMLLTAHQQERFFAILSFLSK